MSTTVSMLSRLTGATLALLAAAALANDSLLIENVTVIDGTGRPPRAAADVLVMDGRFVSINPSGSDAPGDVERLDGTQLYLIPGLIDSHIHLPGGRTGPGNREMVMEPAVGLRVLHGFLYSGVTSVYDSGNHAAFIHRMRADERSGRIVSPRIFATVSLIAPPQGHGCCAGGTVVEDYADGVEKLGALLDMAPDMIKFTRERRGMGPAPRDMPLMTDALLSQLMRLVQERGVRTTVHVSSESLARQAIDAGANAFAHAPYLGRIGAEFANLVATRGVVVSTTISRIEADVAFYDQPLFRDLLTTEELRAAQSNERFVGTPFAAWLGSLRPTIFANVKTLYAAGATLALGTDRTLGAMPHQELKLLVEAGIPPLQALRMGTLNAAAYIGVADQLGSIEPGKLADMVLLGADPTLDIANTTSIAAVFKGGRRIDRAALMLPVNER